MFVILVNRLRHDTQIDCQNPRFMSSLRTCRLNWAKKTASEQRSNDVLPVNTKHLYNICTMLDQNRIFWADVVQMLHKCFVFAGLFLIVPPLPL